MFIWSTPNDPTKCDSISKGSPYTMLHCFNILWTDRMSTTGDITSAFEMVCNDIPFKCFVLKWNCLVMLANYPELNQWCRLTRSSLSASYINWKRYPFNVTCETTFRGWLRSPRFRLDHPYCLYALPIAKRRSQYSKGRLIRANWSALQSKLIQFLTPPYIWLAYLTKGLPKGVGNFQTQ